MATQLYESESCPVRERIERICRGTIQLIQAGPHLPAEDDGLNTVLDACNEALSDLHRSPHFPEGRLSSGSADPADRALEAFLQRFPRFTPTFASQSPA